MPWFWALWPPLPPSPHLSWRRWSCKSAYLRWGLLSSQQSLTTTFFLLFSRMIFAFSARLTLPRGAPLAIQWMLDKPTEAFPSLCWWGQSVLPAENCSVPVLTEAILFIPHHFPNLSSSLQIFLPKAGNPSHPRASSSCCCHLGLCIPLGAIFQWNRKHEPD